MLVLSRRPGEKVIIGGNIEITIQSVKGYRVSLSIKAPKDVQIVRPDALKKEDREH